MRKEKHAGKCIYIGESFWDGKGKGIYVPEESQAVSQKLHVSVSAPPVSAIKKKKKNKKRKNTGEGREGGGGVGGVKGGGRTKRGQRAGGEQTQTHEK